MARRRLGEILVEAGALTEEQLTQALAAQKQRGGRLGRVLVEAGVVTEALVVSSLSRQLGLPIARFPAEVPGALLDVVPIEVCERHGVFPLAMQRDAKGEILTLAMVDPTNIEIIDSIQFRTGRRVIPTIAGETETHAAIRRHYYGEAPRAEVAPQSPAQFAGHEVLLEAEDEIPVVTGVLTTPARPFPAATMPPAPTAFDPPLAAAPHVTAPPIAAPVAAPAVAPPRPPPPAAAPPVSGVAVTAASFVAPGLVDASAGGGASMFGAAGGFLGAEEDEFAPSPSLFAAAPPAVAPAPAAAPTPAPPAEDVAQIVAVDAVDVAPVVAAPPAAAPPTAAAVAASVSVAAVVHADALAEPEPAILELAEAEPAPEEILELDASSIVPEPGAPPRTRTATGAPPPRARTIAGAPPPVAPPPSEAAAAPPSAPPSVQPSAQPAPRIAALDLDVDVDVDVEAVPAPAPPPPAPPEPAPAIAPVDAPSLESIDVDVADSVPPGHAAPIAAAAVDDAIEIDVAPVDVAPIDVAPIDVAPIDVAPVDVAPIDVAPVDVAPVDVAPLELGPIDVALDVTEAPSPLTPPPPRSFAAAATIDALEQLEIDGAEVGDAFAAEGTVEVVVPAPTARATTSEPEPAPAVESPPVVAAGTCPQCNAPRVAGAKFCPMCGLSFTGAARAQSSVPAPAPTAPPQELAMQTPPAAPIASVAPVGAPPAIARAPLTIAEIEALEGLRAVTETPRTTSAGGVDEVGALHGEPQNGVGLAVTHLAFIRSQASVPDDVDVLSGAARALPGHLVPSRAEERTAMWGDADDLAVLVAGAPPPRPAAPSLAADWRDVAEKQIPRKDNRTDVAAVPRSREMFMPAPEDAMPPPTQAAEQQVTYTPAAIPVVTGAPAPWAAFATPAHTPPPIPPPAAPTPSDADKKPGK